MTIALRKPGKDSYTIPKLYRFIVLLNIIGKIINAIIAKRMEYIAEVYQFLPNMHMEGKRQRSTEYAFYITVNRIYRTWNSGQKVASALLLDVSGAFENVSHARLLYNLRKKGIKEKRSNGSAAFCTIDTPGL
jgi:hypothetical protein